MTSKHVFTSYSKCTRCGDEFGIGDRWGWNSDGAVYCMAKCMGIVDKELSKTVDKEQEKRNRKAAERLKGSTGNA